jgi:cell division transport system ATP-binding protein
MIELIEVTKSYQRLLPLLDQASCRIEKGEFAYLTGISGAGKTTVFRMLMGMERPDRGTIRIEGRDVNRLKPHARAEHRRRIGMVFQDYRLLPEESIADNVGLPLRVAGVNAAMERQKVREKLALVGLTGRDKEPVVSLSGGEKQLVSIARALVLSPPVLLADEPTGNLDQAMAWRVMEVLRGINGAGCTVVVATHDLALIRGFRARTLLIKERRLNEVRLIDSPAGEPAAARPAMQT